jgi:hypothetical protein
VVFREAPALTWSEFYLGLVLLAFVLVAALAVVLHRRLRR